MLIEDNPTDIGLLVEAIGDDYDLSVYTCGEKALEAVETVQPGLILLDVTLPGLDGFEIFKRLTTNKATNTIPILFLTGLTKSFFEKKCLSMGAADFLRKPIEPDIVKKRICIQVESLSVKKDLETVLTEMAAREEENTVLERMLFALMGLHAYEKSEHILRTRKIYSILAERLASLHPNLVSRESANIMTRASIFHDIGKAGIPTNQLRQNLTNAAEDDEMMRRHTVIGKRSMQFLATLTSKSRLLEFAAEIAESHHEKWDGTGYPHGLRGEEIPLSARIMAVADVYDALTGGSSGTYFESGLPHDEAVRKIVDGRDGIRPEMYCPRVLAAFLLCQQEISTA
jgi:putative two-component system response regulator